MKQLTITLLLFVLAISAAHSQKQGTIVYENTINIHANLGPDQQAMKAMLPETTTQTYHFIFNEQFGCFKNVPAEMPEGMMVQMPGNESKTWFNFKEDVFRQCIEVDDELFHTEIPMNIAEAKLTGKTKRILDYNCEEYKSEDGDFSFWVTKELPQKISPMPSLFFDGAILAIDNETISYEAVSLLTEVEEEELKPVESQEITQEQFMDLQEEKMNEMKSMNGKVMKIGN